MGDCTQNNSFALCHFAIVANVIEGAHAHACVHTHVCTHVCASPYESVCARTHTHQESTAVVEQQKTSRSCDLVGKMEMEHEGAISGQKPPVSLEDVVDNAKVGVAPPPKKARMDYAQTRESISQSVAMHSSVGSITDHQAPPVELQDCKVNFALRNQEILTTYIFANV